MPTLAQLKKELKNLADPEYAEILRKFFKTGKGEYGEGDVFSGIKVPVQRNIAKEFKDLEFTDLQKLLDSKIHDERSVALFILIGQYAEGDEKTKKQVYNFYLRNTENINNWDLVDSSAPNIVGDYLLDPSASSGQANSGRSKNRKILYKLAKSKNLWERRIAVIATYAFIKNNEFNDTIKIAGVLMNDGHDLIHKAVGWMLREVGKKDEKILEKFLNKHYGVMPRTMLRYSIEKLNNEKRKFYLVK